MSRLDAKYLAFGLLVLASYWFTLRNGILFWSNDSSPSPPTAHGGGGRAHPTFWNTGFHGGK
jgi:hypothetical protein